MKKAFCWSGEKFDKLRKEKTNLAIQSPWPTFDQEINLYLKLAGFLLTAKSIFRFGDLSKENERKLTEYILIGTFLSFGIAILTGLLVQHLTAIM